MLLLKIFHVENYKKSTAKLLEYINLAMSQNTKLVFSHTGNELLDYEIKYTINNIFKNIKKYRGKLNELCVRPVHRNCEMLT